MFEDFHAGDPIAIETSNAGALPPAAARVVDELKDGRRVALTAYAVSARINVQRVGRRGHILGDDGSRTRLLQ